MRLYRHSNSCHYVIAPALDAWTQQSGRGRSLEKIPWPLNHETNQGDVPLHWYNLAFNFFFSLAFSPTPRID
jgi:hypothetical protein